MKGLSFKVSADASNVQKELNKASSSVASFAAKIRKASFVKLSQGADRLATKLQKLALPELKETPAKKKLDILAKRLDKLRGQERKINIDLSALSAIKKIKTLKKQLAQLKKSKKGGELGVSGEKITAKIKELQSRLQKLRNAGSKIPLRISAQNAQATTKKLRDDLKRISTMKLKVNMNIKHNLLDVRKQMAKIASKQRAIKAPRMQGLAGLTKSVARVRGLLSKGLAGAALAGAAGLFITSNALLKMSQSASLTGKALRLVGGGLTGMAGKLKAVAGAMASFGRAAGQMALTALKGAAAAATAAVVALGVALKKAASEAAGLERLGVQFASITGSVEAGADMVGHLREESKRTGVQVGSMATMMRRLLASGMDVEASKKMTSSLLDISGALGLSNEEAKLLGIAISQVASKGVVSMEELRQQIAEKGVPVFDVMAKKLNVTKGEFMKMVADGKVGSEVLIEAFSNLEGPLAKFRGGANRMAATAGGAFNRLKAQIADTFAQAGAPLLDGLAIVVNNITDRIKAWGPTLMGFAQRAGAVLKTLGAAFSGGNFGDLAKLSLTVAAKEFVNTLWAGIRAGVGFLVVGVSEGLKSAWSKIMDRGFWTGVGQIFQGAALAIEVAALKLADKLRPDNLLQNAIKNRESIAKGMFRSGMMNINESGDGRSMVDILKEAAQAAKGEYEEAMKKPMMGTEAEKKELASLWKKAKEAAEAASAARKEAMEKMESQGDTTQAPAKKSDTADKFFKPITTSLARIGGGGRFIEGMVITLDKERNQLLQSINETLKQKPEQQAGAEQKDVEMRNAGFQISAIPPEAPRIEMPEVSAIPPEAPRMEIPAVADNNQAAVAGGDSFSGLGGIINKIAVPVLENLAQISIGLDKERNVLLKSIDSKIGGDSGAVFA